MTQAPYPIVLPFFFFNDTATTEIYTLSLHDALPILRSPRVAGVVERRMLRSSPIVVSGKLRSEEHTSELQSPCNLVCRLLLEKKKKRNRSSLLLTSLAPRQTMHSLSSPC